MRKSSHSPKVCQSNALEFVEAGLPTNQYTDPSHYQDELEKIFFKKWIYVCHANALKRERQYITVSIGSKNIIVLRNSNKNLSAFLNVCRHRGSMLCSHESGQLRSNLLKCPYHQWAYEIDQGRLKGITSFTEPIGFDRENYRLFKVAVREWRGCIFVNLDNNNAWDEQAIFQRSALGLQSFPLEKMVIGKKWKKLVRCNWKIFWENFNECLHCPNIHPELTDLVPLYQRRIVNPKDIPGWEKHISSDDPKFRGGLRQGAETWSADGKAHGRTISGLTEEELDRGQMYATSLPSMFAGCYSDHVRIVRILPRSVNETELGVEWLFEKEALDDPSYDIENVTDFACLVMQQDAQACEINQMGLQSTPELESVLMPEEYLVFGFHNWVRQQMAN